MVYTVSTLFAIYFVVWWVTLFVTLPFGVRSQHEEGGGAPGTDPGAPVASQMGRKLIWTTIVATVVFVAFYALYASHAVTLEDLATLWGLFPSRLSQ